MIGCIRGDGRIGVHRGLCHNCYNATLKAVRLGKTTWEKEVAAGRCLAAKKGTAFRNYRKKSEE